MTEAEMGYSILEQRPEEIIVNGKTVKVRVIEKLELYWISVDLKPSGDATGAREPSKVKEAT